MSKLKDDCPICGLTGCSNICLKNGIIPGKEEEYPYYYGECKCCGKVFVSYDFIEFVIKLNKYPLYPIIGALRNISNKHQWENNKNWVPYIQDQTDLDKYFVQPTIPIDKANLLLIYLYKSGNSFTKTVHLEIAYDFSICVAEDRKEFMELISHLEDEKLVQNMEFEYEPIEQNNTTNGQYKYCNLKLTMEGWKQTDSMINKLPNSTLISEEMRFDETKTNNKHKQSIKEEEINEIKHWLAEYPVSLKEYESGIKKYREKRDFRNALDDLRLSLELLLREILVNKKSLENQQAELGKFIDKNGGSKDCVNLFQILIDRYAKYQNSHIKHDNKVIESEIELMIEFTTLLMRQVIKLKKMKQREE